MTYNQSAPGGSSETSAGVPRIRSAIVLYLFKSEDEASAFQAGNFDGEPIDVSEDLIGFIEELSKGS